MRMSDDRCTRCGVEHDHRRVKIGGRVMLAGLDPAAGSIGRVVSWTRYGTPLSIRVEFAEGVLEPSEPRITRANFKPCQLLPVVER